MSDKEASSAPAGKTSSSSSSRTLGGILVPIGLLLLGGLAAGILVDRSMGTEGFFQLPDELRPVHPPGDEMLKRMDAASGVNDYMNAALAIGLFGAILGAAGGAVAGTVRASLRRALMGAGGGLLLGGLFGALGGCIAMLLHRQLGMMDDPYATFKAIAVHGTAWAIAGVGIGLATALPVRHLKYLGLRVTAVVMTAILAAVAFAPLTAIFFPLRDSTGPLVPDGTGNRILWTMTAAALIGLAIARTAVPKPYPDDPARNSK